MCVLVNLDAAAGAGGEGGTLAIGARGADRPKGARIPLQLVDADRLARAADKRHRGPNASGPRGVTRTKIVLEGSAPRAQWLEIVDGWELENRKSGYGAGGRLNIHKNSPGRVSFNHTAQRKAALTRPSL